MQQQDIRPGQVSVACLGPAGTYSEDAAVRFFGGTPARTLLPTLDEVLTACESGAVSHCVLAIENTTEGAVPRALDLLYSTSLSVCGEVSLAINHCMLSATGSLDEVVRVRAHAHALAQCHGWLTAHAPHLVREAVLSNAEAAHLASGDPASAAIASVRSAREHGIQVVAQAIQDDPGNRTRFFAWCKPGRMPPPNPAGKTSLIVSVPNVAGALYKIVEPFATHGVSMSRFESRPVKTGRWEYNFYIDVVGGTSDANVAAALAQLQAIAAVKVLGSYLDYSEGDLRIG
jgi:chorismate mutase/prephenate dehydratase